MFRLTSNTIYSFICDYQIPEYIKNFKVIRQKDDMSVGDCGKVK